MQQCKRGLSRHAVSVCLCVCVFVHPSVTFVDCVKTNNISSKFFHPYVTITTLVPNLVGASWATGAPQKLWVPRNSYSNVIKLQI